MSIKKCVITKGIYLDKELRLLVSFDEKDKPLDIFNLDVTKVGVVCEATVEKVLNDIDACILKLSTGDKGFIEKRKLKPDFFIERHSDKKLVCQSDRFLVQISQDKKGTKPYSCNFIKDNSTSGYRDFIDFFIEKFADKDCEIVSDLDEIISKNLNIRAYTDESFSLWQLFDLTKLLDNVTLKVAYIKNGGNIVIESTEAMTVIDVNSGKNGGKGSPMETNRQALEEIAAQLRLRSISGIIIIDLLKVSNKEEDKLIEIAKDAFKDDYSNVTIHGFTNLGLMEITRSRLFSPIIL
ncbi:ribonuclease G [Pseudobutyrivibrio sp. 49]|uniref:ribonuclease E/G n=1 Tax=unclassified Pseudobutyrivibrio TaxID=2638619 RepID=UPI00088E2E37|nr:MULTISPECIES: ribonuclease E/G [unclassified Pseudobutyrivibrio]SDH44483.1 ribonuclease G [Pseudobutyrivibrio sp. 49]SFN43883.1 ribonuclease G [Pseudobutyrivibrio sp. UC1225]